MTSFCRENTKFVECTCMFLQSLTKKEIQKKSAMLKRHGFDAFLSSKCVPIERSLPDFRNEACKTEYQMNKNELIVKISIIICFHNVVSKDFIIQSFSKFSFTGLFFSFTISSTIHFHTSSNLQSTTLLELIEIGPKSVLNSKFLSVYDRRLM